MADSNSNISGNGEIKYSNKPAPAAAPVSKVHVKIINETGKKIALKVKYPVKGSYGISVGAGGSRKEVLPIGTKLYKDGEITITAAPLYIVTDDARQTFTIK